MLLLFKGAGLDRGICALDTGIRMALYTENLRMAAIVKRFRHAHTNSKVNSMVKTTSIIGKITGKKTTSSTTARSVDPRILQLVSEYHESADHDICRDILAWTASYTSILLFHHWQLKRINDRFLDSDYEDEQEEGEGDEQEEGEGTESRSDSA